jgi:hypothetical protein
MDDLLPRTGDVIPELSDGLKRSFLNIDAFGRPLKSPIPQATVDRARAYRLGRMREQVVAHDCAAILMYSPINIRYAFDYTNMQIWSSREATRYGLLFGEGPAIMHEYKGSQHMVRNGAGVDDRAPATTWLYMISDSEVQAREALGRGDRRPPPRAWRREPPDRRRQARPARPARARGAGDRGRSTDRNWPRRRAA